MGIRAQQVVMLDNDEKSEDEFRAIQKDNAKLNSIE